MGANLTTIVSIFLRAWHLLLGHLLLGRVSSTTGLHVQSRSNDTAMRSSSVVRSIRIELLSSGEAERARPA